MFASHVDKLGCSESASVLAPKPIVFLVEKKNNPLTNSTVFPMSEILTPSS